MITFAKVTEVQPVISGTSDNGNDWEKQVVVFETLALEPQTLAVEFMGERRTKQTKTLNVGDQVEVNFRIACNKYLDKWYTRLDGLSVKALQTQTPKVQTAIQMPVEEEAF